jgi:hypothetical protein
MFHEMCGLTATVHSILLGMAQAVGSLNNLNWFVSVEET